MTTAFSDCPKTERTIPQSAIRLTAPFAQGSQGLGRRSAANSLCTGEPRCGGGGVAPINHASPYGKGRCRAERDGGDKKVGFRYSKFEAPKSIRKKGVTCYALFALVKNGNKVKRAAGERGKKPAVSRTARRRCLSCIILPQTLVKFFSEKNLTKRRCEGRWCEAPEGISSAAFIQGSIYIRRSGGNFYPQRLRFV